MLYLAAEEISDPRPKEQVTNVASECQAITEQPSCEFHELNNTGQTEEKATSADLLLVQTNVDLQIDTNKVKAQTTTEAECDNNLENSNVKSFLIDQNTRFAYIQMFVKNTYFSMYHMQNNHLIAILI